MTAPCTQGVDTGFVALGYAKVAFLGVVQGFSELMPISSTAHMRIVPALLGWRDPGSAFSAAMQMAALVAVISYFWVDVRGLVLGSAGAVAQRRWGDPRFKLGLMIIAATVPIVIGGSLLSHLLNQCGSPLRTLTAIGWAYIVMAVLLGLTELLARHRKTMDDSTMLDAILIGIAQVGALLPGVSRSGSTLTAALALGYKREEAARFSFLIGLPAIAAAGLKEMWELHKVHLDAHGWSVLGAGLVVASVSAFVAIWTLMRILERYSAWPFAVYRLAMGVFLLVAVSRAWLS